MSPDTSKAGPSYDLGTGVGFYGIVHTEIVRTARNRGQLNRKKIVEYDARSCHHLSGTIRGQLHHMSSTNAVVKSRGCRCYPWPVKIEIWLSRFWQICTTLFISGALHMPIAFDCCIMAPRAPAYDVALKRIISSKLGSFCCNIMVGVIVYQLHMWCKITCLHDCSLISFYTIDILCI